MKTNALVKRRTTECGDMRPTFVSSEQWSHLIKHPLICADKADAPLVIWGRMEDNVEMSYSGLPRCIWQNLKYITALQIDVDNGCTIEEFMSEYSYYSYQLYTSYSFGFKEGHRFRVVFPLIEPIYTKHICPSTRELLEGFFPMVDTTCFDRCHWQVLPAIRSEDAPYKYVQHSGELLDAFPVQKFASLADDYETYRALNQQIRELDKIGKRPPKERNPHAKALAWAQQQINEIPEGSRNSEYFRLLMWLKTKVECELDDVLELEVPCDMQDEFTEMASRIFNG